MLARYGEINGTTWRLHSWCIYHLAHKVSIHLPSGKAHTVYVDDMAGLRNAIQHYLGES